MSNDLVELKDLLDKGTQIIMAEEEKEKRLKNDAWIKTVATFNTLWPKIYSRIPESMRPFMQVCEADVSDLILTGKSTGMYFKFDNLFPVHLSVNYFKEELTVEFFVPAMVKIPQGFRAASPDDDDPNVWANEIRLQFEDPALAVYWAKRRFDFMMELQAKFDASQRKPVYVQVEETQGKECNVLGLTIDAGPLQTYIDNRIRLVTQFLGQ